MAIHIPLYTDLPRALIHEDAFVLVSVLVLDSSRQPVAYPGIVGTGAAGGSGKEFEVGRATCLMRILPWISDQVYSNNLVPLGKHGACLILYKGSAEAVHFVPNWRRSYKGADEALSEAESRCDHSTPGSVVQ